MRPLIANLFISLDGVVESPDQWQEHFDEVMMADLTEQITDQGAVLMGRVTYEEWASYWPSATDEPFASFINSTPKYVVSNTLRSVEWGGLGDIDLFGSDFVTAIKRLKEQTQPGTHIGTAGSPTLVRSLLRHHLVDELRLMVHPVVAGKGRKLFHDGDDLQHMTLLGAKATPSGTVMMSYQPRR